MMEKTYIKMLSILCSLSLYMAQNIVAQPQNSIPHSPFNAKIIKGTHVFSQTTLYGQVAEAMDFCRKNDLSVIEDLMDIHAKEADKVLASVKSYSHDPNPVVRLGVIEAASYSHSLQALKLLSIMAQDVKIGGEAIDEIYRLYSEREFQTWGGEWLKNSLITAFIVHRHTPKGALLLSNYKKEKRISSLLQRRLRTYRSTSMASGALSEVIALEMSLAELGDYSALNKVLVRFSRAASEDLLLLVRDLKFVSNKVILASITNLLKDKRELQQLSVASPIHRTLSKVRVCDEALVALSRKTGYKVRKSFRIFPPKFTDKELNDAYSYFHSLFDGKNEIVKQ